MAEQARSRKVLGLGVSKGEADSARRLRPQPGDGTASAVCFTYTTQGISRLKLALQAAFLSGLIWVVRGPLPSWSLVSVDSGSTIQFIGDCCLQV